MSREIVCSNCAMPSNAKGNLHYNDWKFCENAKANRRVVSSGKTFAIDWAGYEDKD